MQTAGKRAHAMKDGRLAGWGRYELSPDGSTLVVTADRMRVLLEGVGSPCHSATTRVPMTGLGQVFLTPTGTERVRSRVFG